MTNAAQIWRLVAHHQKSKEALAEMRRRREIAIGWSSVGDLNRLNPESIAEISKAVNLSASATKNVMSGPSLWNLFREMEVGDYVIVTANGRRQCVFEVTGDYFYNTESPIFDYSHMRSATNTDLDPDELWHSCSGIAEGQNSRWTLARCSDAKETRELVFREGARYSVTATAIERDSLARRECIKIHGFSCAACKMNFEKRYGEIGKEFIHVHHRVDLALRGKNTKVDPKQDLVPLCPNCHAMIHKERPAMSLEKLRAYLREDNT